MLRRDKILRLLILKNLTQRDLAAIVGVTYQTISSYLKKDKPWRHEHAVKIQKALGLSDYERMDIFE